MITVLSFRFNNSLPGTLLNILNKVNLYYLINSFISDSTEGYF